MSEYPKTTETAQPTHQALPVGTRIGEFEITGLVGIGGFGIVYKAEDHSLQREVALKEYMPLSLAHRGPDGSVAILSEQHREAFEAGRSSFVNEARLLARFDHPSLLKVYRFWQAGGTAYMVMPLYAGKTLKQFLDDRPKLDEARMRKFLAPLMEALEVIHNENCFHRDISPENIILLENGRPVLLDFGAARRVIGDMTRDLTVFVKRSYAPIEQYAETPGMQQGAWTDIYTLAALIYFMITRRLPPPSVSRVVTDAYEPLTKLAAGQYSERFLAGLDSCLRVKPEQRPQNIAEMRTLLGIRSDKPRAGATASRPRASYLQPLRLAFASLKAGKLAATHLGLSLAVGLGLAGAGGGLYWWQTSTQSASSTGLAGMTTELPAQAKNPEPPARNKAAIASVEPPAPAPSPARSDESDEAPPASSQHSNAQDRRETRSEDGADAAPEEKPKHKARRSSRRRADRDEENAASRYGYRRSERSGSGGASEIVDDAKQAGRSVKNWFKRTFK